MKINRLAGALGAEVVGVDLTQPLSNSDFARIHEAFLTHAMALTAAVAVVWFGVRGIERIAKLLIPLLALLVVVLALRAVTLPGAAADDADAVVVVPTAAAAGADITLATRPGVAA